MKKYVFTLVLAAIVLITFTACNGNDNTPIGASGSQANESAEILYPDVYLFHESVEMEIYFRIHPAWLNLYSTTEIKTEHDLGNTQTLVVYNITTREEFGMGESGGVLFWISRLPSALFAEVSEDFDGVILSQRWGYVYTLNYPREFQYLYDRESEAAIQYLNMMSYLEPWNDNFVTSSFRLTDSDANSANPFTSALLEYFADGVEGSPFGFDTWAGIVNIDGHGTNGVLAIRHDLIDSFPVMVARVFYLFDGELFYYDIRNYENFPQVMITHEGRLIQNVATGRDSHSYTVFGVGGGRMIPFQTVFVEIFDRDADDGANYYTIDDGWWTGIENASSMTKDDFDEFISRFRLFSFTSPHDTNDETEQILVMPLETRFRSMS